MPGSYCVVVRRFIRHILSPPKRGSDVIGENGTPPSLRPAQNAGRSFWWGYNLTSLRAYSDFISLGLVGSFTPQRHDRIDPGSAPGRQVTGHQGYCQEEQRHDGKGGGIGCAHPIQ